MPDIARLIWGDAVIDAAIARDKESWDTEHSAWRHASGYQPGDNKSGLCCIVGHLNWLAYEQAGRDPAAEGLEAWPGADEAFGDLCDVRPDTPDTVVVSTAQGPVKVSTVDVIDQMITANDTTTGSERRNRGWWGPRLGEWMGATFQDRAYADSCITPEPDATDNVDVPVPVAVAR